MESIGRNPNSADKIFTPLILSLALIEALGIYALIIAFLLAGKVLGNIAAPPCGAPIQKRQGPPPAAPAFLLFRACLPRAA